MTNTTTNSSALLRPEDVDALLILPTLAASVAAAACRVVRTRSTTFRIPRVTNDPDAAWVAEGAEIPVSDLGTDEVPVTPSKVAGLSVITNELAADTENPEAAEAVGEGLARDIARRVDEAFLGALAAPAPAGLAALTGATRVDAPTTWANLDDFAEAVSAADGVGASITSWLMHPTDLLALSLLRKGTGSNETLLQVDPTQPARRIVEGRPILTSPYATVGTVYGLDEATVVMVVREDAEVVSDASPFFTSDRTAVRATMRVGFGYSHPAGVVRIVRAAAATV